MSGEPEKVHEAASSEAREASEAEHVEDTKPSLDMNLVYAEDEEPEFHAQTWFALAAMFCLNLVQVFGLMGPPAGVRESTMRTPERSH